MRGRVQRNDTRHGWETGTGFAWFGKFITGTGSLELSGNRFDPFFRGVFCLKYCLILEMFRFVFFFFLEIKLDDLEILSINSTKKSLERERLIIFRIYITSFEIFFNFKILRAIKLRKG